MLLLLQLQIHKPPHTILAVDLNGKTDSWHSNLIGKLWYFGIIDKSIGTSKYNISLASRYLA